MKKYLAKNQASNYCMRNIYDYIFVNILDHICSYE